MFNNFKENLQKKVEEMQSLDQKGKKKKTKENYARLLNDFLPLIVFIVVYKLSGAKNPIILATLCMIIVTFLTLTISYFLTKKIAKMPLISALMLGIFGMMTIFSGDDIFIKIKPTLINLVFALVLFYGYFSKKPLMSYLFGGELKLNLNAWLTMSWRWAWFFVGLALLNEIIWRNFSTDFWVNFKLFGVLPISIIFTATQIPFMIKNAKKEDESSS